MKQDFTAYRPSPLGRWGLLCGSVGVLLASLAIGSAQPEANSSAKSGPKRLLVRHIDYNRDIRPILSGKCWTCHGNDSKAVMAGLRLDSKLNASKKLKSGLRAIVPGNPKASELVSRIHAGGSKLMPPAYSNKALTAEEKTLLEAWIKQGAEFKQHWGFVTPVMPVVPKNNHPTWNRTIIDRLVYEKLGRAGLNPSVRANKSTLARRVALDLTGLPPDPMMLADYMADTSEQAYEKLVDKLLASPAYGERMAMDWMDYARYADSNGYHSDYERYQWRWRDWVIDAFNRNMPFDQFSVEQLAGDLLPKPTEAQLIATGFNRNHRINTEGGVIAEEWRVETVIDRVETTSTTWLGLTTGCARCHDHKYDPISQKEFYSLYSYFNNVPENGIGIEQPVNHPPYISAPTPPQKKAMAAINAQVKALETKTEAEIKRNWDAAQAWDPGTLPVSTPSGVLARYLFTPAPLVLAGSAPLPMTANGGYTPGYRTGAYDTQLNVKNGTGYLNLGQVASIERDQAFSYSAWLNPRSTQGVPFSKMDSSKNFQGWDLYLANGQVMAHLISSWPNDAIKVVSKAKIDSGKWTHVAMTYDGSSKAAGVKLYVDGKLTETTVESDNLKGSIKSKVAARVGGRTGSDSYMGLVDDLSLYSKKLEPAEVASLYSVSPTDLMLKVPLSRRSETLKRALATEYLRQRNPGYLADEKALLAARAEHDKVKSDISTVMVMQEMSKPRIARVLIRGLYDKPGEPVKPMTPKALPPMPTGVPNNRLGLAKWIVSPKNPLTARVTVNRLWERFFGTGIVATSEDFGTRAEFPSHPELLDYLAVDFVKSGWNLKAMMKQIAMSEVYRQSSTVNPVQHAKDPENRLMSRGPRFRLPAEVIRDQALSAAGLLDRRLGGSSSKPYMPPGIWDEGAFGNLRNYKQDAGAGLYRRSLYTFWKRTGAPPNMTLFDMTGREMCRVKRSRTNTPMQALVLMNDTTYVEAARVLAQRVTREAGPDLRSQIQRAYMLVLNRPVRPDELKILENGYQRRFRVYKANLPAAKKLLEHGEAPVDTKLDPVALASLTTLTSTILNLDEAVTKE